MARCPDSRRSQFDGEFFRAAAFQVLPDLGGDAGQQGGEGVLRVFDVVAVDAQRAEGAHR